MVSPILKEEDPSFLWQHHKKVLLPIAISVSGIYLEIRRSDKDVRTGSEGTIAITDVKANVSLVRNRVHPGIADCCICFSIPVPIISSNGKYFTGNWGDDGLRKSKIQTGKG